METEFNEIERNPVGDGEFEIVAQCENCLQQISLIRSNGVDSSGWGVSQRDDETPEECPNCELKVGYPVI